MMKSHQIMKSLKQNIFFLFNSFHVTGRWLSTEQAWDLLSILFSKQQDQLFKHLINLLKKTKKQASNLPSITNVRNVLAPANWVVWWSCPLTTVPSLLLECWKAKPLVFTLFQLIYQNKWLEVFFSCTLLSTEDNAWVERMAFWPGQHIIAPDQWKWSTTASC